MCNGFCLAALSLLMNLFTRKSFYKHHKPNHDIHVHLMFLEQPDMVSMELIFRT